MFYVKISIHVYLYDIGMIFNSSSGYCNFWLLPTLKLTLKLFKKSFRTNIIMFGSDFSQSPSSDMYEDVLLNYALAILDKFKRPKFCRFKFVIFNSPCWNISTIFTPSSVRVYCKSLSCLIYFNISNDYSNLISSVVFHIQNLT